MYLKASVMGASPPSNPLFLDGVSVYEANQSKQRTEPRALLGTCSGSAGGMGIVDLAAHNCNPSTWEAAARGAPGGQGPLKKETEELGRQIGGDQALPGQA